MALSAAIVWEVRTAGSDVNGGGFKAGATGTDYSQQDAANAAGNNISTVDAVTAVSTTVTSATASFTSAIVGNVIYLAGGTGPVTAAWYEVITFVNATTITVDRNIIVSTGVTMNIGGALATLTQLAANMVTSNKAFVKAGTGYTTTATITFGAASITPSNTGPYSHIVGYTTTRTDGGRFTLTLSTNGGLTGLLFSNNGWKIENALVDCASLGTSTGIRTSGLWARIRNCKVTAFSTTGINAAGSNCAVLDCEVANGTAGNAIIANTCQVLRCWVHDNVAVGVSLSTGSVSLVAWNILSNNSGATNDGIKNVSIQSFIHHNTVYKSGRHGIASSDVNAYVNLQCRDNLLVQNGGYGIQLSAAGNPADAMYDGNAFFSNTSGTRNNMDDTATNAVDGVSPYTNTLDVILTGDPFTNAAGNDYTLNNTAGAGAACRAAGTPGGFPGSSVIGYLDIGAVQHQDPAGSGGGTSVAIFGG